MPLTAGTRLGSFEILSAIGAGGMGEVYRARDLRLKREVAIKILPEVFAKDPDRLARFQREAELLATLNHPNIAHIYGSEESNDVKAFVLELVDGPTIADRIAQGPQPLDLVLPIAKQIVDALEAAHGRGVIHRDLKPANIKLRPDGTVKVLDFGLAKLLEPQPSTRDAITASPSITTAARTQAGALLGTAAYMSPEQTRGKRVDQRTDIWAFGCVLFEMLTGRSVFAGETTSDTIAYILEREPDWHALASSTPAQIRTLLRRCLQKDPERRPDIADVRSELERLLATQRRPRRVLELRRAVAGGALALMLLTGAWWWRAGQLTPPTPPEPVSILVADFGTNDPTFDHTLEPLLRIVLESARFISAYDRTQFRRSFGIRPPELLDERTALELAVKQGLGVVLSGSLDRRGDRYELSMKATHAITGNLIASTKGSASNKDEVLSVATKLATTVRETLGDDKSDSGRRFAMDALSATSLEAVREYARGAEAMSQSKFDEALQSFSKAVARDANFGLAHAGMAIASRNLDKQRDAEDHIKEAIRHLDGMTERERYRTRGLFYYLTSDYQSCVNEFGDLITRYAGDASARNNLALCLTYLRRLPEALEQMRHVVKILPNRALYRTNLALYAAYSGDFQTAETESRALKEPGTFGLLALAFAQILQGSLPPATDTYQTLGKLDEQGASYATSGLGDLALYEGRFSDAARIYAKGGDTDLALKNSDRAAAKFAALAYVEVLRSQKRAALAAAEKALASSNAAKIQFLVARVFIDIDEIPKAQQLAASLASDGQAESQAYAKIVEGEAALKGQDVRLAIKLLSEANQLLDVWIGHYDLGRAYFVAGAFTQADSEFDRCLMRRGEALALFLDEEPSYGHVPSIYYYVGRVREEMKSSRFADSYRTYLSIRGKSKEDPFVDDIRRRVNH